ncbi:MAG: NAD(P)/FAD-dependent oxidoreductase, partial [Spirochaetes bacterium]|nr:NAD(P)/FAD-dependent oxidoreductase [Spirochaetota bacterium]
MVDYDVVVIGAGNAGLMGAVTLAQKGAKVLVLERHNVPGGCATSFCRGRFEFEVSLHQLSGMGSPQRPGPLRALLDSVGVLNKLEFVEMKDLYRVVYPGKLDIALRADRSSVIASLQERFPQEKDTIAKFFDFVYEFFTEVIGAFYLADPEISPQKYPLYFKYALVDTQTILDRYFKDRLLKLALSVYWTYMGIPPRFLPFSDMAALLFSYIEFKPYHLKGGSQMLSNALVEALRGAGGKIWFNCEAERIVVKDGKVVAVKIASGEEISTRYVLSNASAITTFVDLIDEDEVPVQIFEQMRARTVGTSFFTVFLGMDCQPTEVGISEATNFVCCTDDADDDYAQSKRLTCEKSSFLLSCYDVADPSFSPAGTCQAALVTMKYAEPWLRLPPTQYYDEKFRCAEQLLKKANEVFPGLIASIEEMDIATPLTHLRYLGHPGGGAYGFDQYAKDSPLFI